MVLTSAGAGTNAAAGSYPITATSAAGLGLTNYTISYSNGTLTVANALLTVTAKSTNKIYGSARTFAGTEFTLTSGTLFNGNTLTNVTLTSVGAGTNATIGSYPINASAAAGPGLTNYTVSYVTGTLTVTNAPLTVTANSTNKVYGGAQTFAGNEFTLTGGTLFNGNTLTNVTLASAGAGTNAVTGGYPITVTNAAGLGLTNYTISYSNGMLTVANALLTVMANSTNKIYGSTRTFAGTEFTITGGTLFNGNTLTNVALASAGSVSNAAVGSYAITVTNALGAGLTNYLVGYSDGTLTVGSASLLITALDTNKNFGDVLIFGGVEFVVAGLLNADVVSSAALASDGAMAGAAAGNYPVTITNALGAGLGNYSIAYLPGTLQVTSASQPFLITALVVSNGLAMITWSAVSNESYRLMFTDELAGTNWNELAPDVLATGTNATATNSVDGVEQRFYRVWRP